MTCECASQEGKHCKHIYALIHFINTDQSLSQTSLDQQWGAPSAKAIAKDMYAKGMCITEITKGKKREFGSDDDIEFDVHLEHIKRPCILKIWLKEYRFGFDERKKREERRKLAADEQQKFIAAICNKCISNLIILCGNFPTYNWSINGISVTPNCYTFYTKNVILNDDRIISLCTQTLEQSQCDVWYSARHVRIFAAKRAHCIKTQSKKTKEKLAQDFLVPTKMVGRAKENCDYGNEKEAVAVKEYQQLHKLNGIKVIKTGIVVSKYQNWLCCSPDRVVEENVVVTKLLEVKCPISIKKKPVIDPVSKNFNVSYLHNINGNVELKPGHLYYTQCQVQMYVTGLESCDLYIYSPVQSCTVAVPRNNVFLRDNIPKMENFYFNFFLPILVESSKENNVLVTISNN